MEEIKRIKWDLRILDVSLFWFFGFGKMGKISKKLTQGYLFEKKVENGSHIVL
jgi:hypothetical protein